MLVESVLICVKLSVVDEEKAEIDDEVVSLARVKQSRFLSVG